MATHHRVRSMRCLGAAVSIVLLATVIAQGQQSEQATDAATTTQVVRELRAQVAELKAAIQELRAQSAQYRSETAQLRTEVQRVAAQLPATGTAVPPAAEAAKTETAPQAEEVARLQDQYNLLSGKVNEQYQTKVESASKYRGRWAAACLTGVRTKTVGCPSTAGPL